MPSRPARPSHRDPRVARLALSACAAILLFCPGSACLQSQQPLIASFSDTPAPTSAAIGSPAAATLTGSVADTTGALVPGARIALQPADGTPGLTASSDSAGRFRFLALPPGAYSVAISAPGFESSTLPEIQLQPGEARVLAAANLAIPVNRADVVVTVTRKELATEEIHAAEHQRVLGFPDFYTSFVWNAAPLDAGQKFSLALHATTDRMSFVGAALVAGGEQVQNTFPSYGQGLRGYAKRYGAAYTDALAGKMIGSAIFPSLFRQDPRYFYKGTGTYKQRAVHAMLSAVLARGDNGRLEPNYSHILGNAAAGALSTAYHPSTDSAAKLALDNALLGTLGEAAVNLTREFLLKPFMTGRPATP